MTNSTKTAASYARSADGGPSALTAQHDRNVAHARHAGFEIPAYCRYEDVGSALDHDRPGLARLVAAAHDGRVTHVFAADRARFSRRIWGLDMLLALLGVTVIFVENATGGVR